MEQGQLLELIEQSVYTLIEILILIRHLMSLIQAFKNFYTLNQILIVFYYWLGFKYV